MFSTRCESRINLVLIHLHLLSLHPLVPQNAMTAAGFAVTTFTSTTVASAPGWLSPVVVVPELQSGASSMCSSSVRASISANVHAGGLLVSAYDTNIPWLNGIFGWSLSSCGGTSSVTSSKTGGAWTSVPALSAFVGAPSTIAYANDVRSFCASSLPAGSHSIYTSSSSGTTVAAIPYGSGAHPRI